MHEEPREMIDLDGSTGTGAADAVVVMEIEEDSDDDDHLINMHANATPKKIISASANEEAMNLKADGELLRKWMDSVIEYNDFLYPDTAVISNPINVSIITLIRKFDTMQYFHEESSKVFPTICLLARIHLESFPMLDSKRGYFLLLVMQWIPIRLKCHLNVWR